MPPQQTNIPAETGLVLDLPIALTKDAMVDALATPRLNASIAALDDDALSEKRAGGPTAASTRSVLWLLKRYWRAFRELGQRQSLRSTLPQLSESQLMDIGLTRGELEQITPQLAIDRLRDSTTYLWSRGV